METYTLPREAFDVLVESMGGKQKAEILAKTLESAVNNIQQKAKEESLEQRQFLHIALKDELKQELVTREIFEERFKVIEEKFKVMEERFSSLHFKMNIFIAVALISLTFANPTFVEFIKAIF